MSDDRPGMPPAQQDAEAEAEARSHAAIEGADEAAESEAAGAAVAVPQSKAAGETAAGAPDDAASFPLNRPDGDTAAEAEAPSEPAAGPEPDPQAPDADGFTPRCAFVSLVLGLLPFFGVIPSVVWAYSGSGPAPRRTLARAMLLLHGICLCILLVALTLWVLRLAGLLRF